MERRGVDGDTCAGRNVVAFDLKVAHRSAWYTGHRRVDAHGFLEGHLEELELSQTFEGERCAAGKTEPVHLCAQLVLPLRVPAQQVDERGDRRGERIVRRPSSGSSCDRRSPDP
jgi:hypothetical protein